MSGMAFTTRHILLVFLLDISPIICEILSQTSAHGGIAAWGYPDDTYFARVKDELAALGVVPTDNATDEVRSSSLGSRDRIIQVQ